MARAGADVGLRAASRVISRVVNPGGRPDEDKLHEAVAGRLVVVTGASYGIGEVTARKLAAAGGSVVLVARSQDRLEEIAAEISGAGGVAHAHAADLTDTDQVAALAEAVLERHGGADVIVNNAGKSIRRSIELSYERFHDFERTIGVNYLGPVRLILALLPGMRERGDGHIVNVSTIGVRVPPAPRWAAYQASKAAFDVFLRSMAPEIAGDGVACTSIYMSLVRTRMSEPTPIFRYVPGLRPAQAADVVCKAIVDRPRTVEPWWVTPTEVGTEVVRGPLEFGMGLWHRLTDDSASARGRRSPRS